MGRDEHLSVDQIYLTVFESEPLSQEAVEHLAGCSACRQRVAEIEGLRRELGIAARSAPSSEALHTYAALYEHVQTARRSAVEQAWHWISAALLLDSRAQPLQAGVRNLSLRQYRLLFTTPSADIEFLVVPDGRARSIEGDLLVTDDALFGLPALIQLVPLAADGMATETESDGQGRFRLEGLAVGTYEVMVTPAWGEAIRVDAMDIT